MLLSKKQRRINSFTKMPAKIPNKWEDLERALELLEIRTRHQLKRELKQELRSLIGACPGKEYCAQIWVDNLTKLRDMIKNPQSAEAPRVTQARQPPPSPPSIQKKPTRVIIRRAVAGNR